MQLTKHGLLVLATALFATSVCADPVTFSGTDAGATGPSSNPNSDAAAAEFDAAAALLGDVNILDFESTPLGAFDGLAVTSGVTMDGTDIMGGLQYVLDSQREEGCSAIDCGFNTTTGGSHFVQLYGGTLEFVFAEGVQGFAAYFTGVESPPSDYPDEIVGLTVFFSDGGSSFLAIPYAPPVGLGSSFFGLIEADRSITSVRVNAYFDIISLDDVRLLSVNSVSVPEPGTLALLGLGLAGLGLSRRRKAH